MFNYEQNAFSAQNPGTPDTIRFLDCNRSPVYSGYTNADGHTGATQQIWSSKLVNGLPVPYGSNTAVPEEVNKLAQYGYPAGGNSNLFSPNDGSNLTEHGKQPYQNVMFQFLKHETGSNAGYYEYNSAYNHAYFDEATEDNVKPYFESLRRNDEDKLNNGQNEAGGFYPFVSNLNGASYYRNFFREDFRSYSAWKTNYEKFTRVDGTGGSQQKGVFYGTADMHFGMVMDFDFYLPEYGTVNGTANGDPITFQFSGDDDLWVYIDDELVLDVGGGHGAISGDINFKTQKSYVEDATQRAGANYAAQHVGAVTKDINVEGDKIHNIKIFYLERYSGVSNCRIKFNLPPIPPATVNVKKDVTTLDGTDVSVPNDEFRFNIRATEQNGTTINTANRDYEIVDNQNNVVGNGTTDASGNFKIKADQTARFSGFKATDKFAVTEYIDNVEKYNQVNIDGVLAGKGNTVYATPLAQITNKGKTVEFTNILTDPLATAKFNKTADALKDVDGNYTGEYEIYLTVTGATPGRKVNVTDVVSKYFTVVSRQALLAMQTAPQQLMLAELPIQTVIGQALLRLFPEMASGAVTQYLQMQAIRYSIPRQEFLTHLKPIPR